MVRQGRAGRALIPGEQLGKHAGKATLVLDVNHTLVSGVSSPLKNYDFACDVPGTNAVTLSLKRPYVDKFLSEAAKSFELVAFTSCEKHLADPILDKLDPAGDIFAYRLFVDSCSLGRQDYLKDLSMLGRGLERVMIVDDSPDKCELNPDNWIPVSRFEDDLKDRELLDLIPFLQGLSDMEDVRPAIVKKQEQLGVRNLVRRNNLVLQTWL